MKFAWSLLLIILVMSCGRGRTNYSEKKITTSNSVDQNVSKPSNNINPTKANTDEIPSEVCAERISQAIDLISTMKSDKEFGFTALDLANYLRNAELSYGMLRNDFYANEKLIGLVKHGDTKVIYVDCSLNKLKLSFTLIHESFHHLVNVIKKQFDKTYIEATQKGIELATNFDKNSNVVFSWTEADWTDYYTYVFDTIFDESSAYRFQGIFGDQQYDTKEEVYKQLNNFYIIPLFKFSLKQDTFNAMMNQIDEEDRKETKLEDAMISFRNKFIQEKGSEIKSAIIEFAKKNNDKK